jgi:uncharacterized MnhB-related membrane protein
MPTLPEILDQLQFISQEAALLGLFVTASIILVGRDWRSLILALLIQYILVGLVLSRLVRPDIATLKVLIGAFICPVLFLSARQVSVSGLATNLAMKPRLSSNRSRSGSWWRRSYPIVVSLIKGQDRRRRPAATGLMFRVFGALLMILVAINLSNAIALPGLPSAVNTAVYWLILAGLITLALTEDPIKVGHGLFTALVGFELFYATVENSLLLIGLWGATNLLIALAIGYLAVVRGTGPEEEV